VVLLLVQDDERVIQVCRSCLPGAISNRGESIRRGSVGVDLLSCRLLRSGRSTGDLLVQGAGPGIPAAPAASTAAGSVGSGDLLACKPFPPWPWASLGSCRCRPGPMATRSCLVGESRPRTASGSASWAGWCGRGVHHADREHVRRADGPLGAEHPRRSNRRLASVGPLRINSSSSSKSA